MFQLKKLGRRCYFSKIQLTELGMGRYRYQILDTFDTSAWKESIDTGKKYRYFDTPSLRYRSIVVSGFIIEIARRW